MKRWISLVLVILLLSGCGGNGAEQATQQSQATEQSVTQLLVGYSKQDITPAESVPLRGSGNTSLRMSQGILDYLYVTCTALSDQNGTTALLFTIDNSGAHAQVMDPIRLAVSEATGVPVAYISVSASHTHSGPDMMNTKESYITPYRKLVQKQMLLAAQEALADRLPATMEIATVETQGMTFVRRYFLENGTLAGENHGDFSASPIARHESEADNALQMIRFVRSGGKSVLLANFQAHPTRVVAVQANHKDISADFVGAFRTAAEEMLDCHVAYFTGASGNLRTLSRIKEENRSQDYRQHGQLLAKYILQAQFAPCDAGLIRTAAQTYVGQVNHAEDHLVVYATEVNEYWRATGDKEVSTAMARERGMESPHHAGAILAKAKLEQTMEVPTAVLAVGDVVFAMIPYEMFDTNGMEIKAASPYAMTFLLTCTNDSLVYVPSSMGYENGGYEVHQAKLVPGSGEELAELYISMLLEVHDEA